MLKNAWKSNKDNEISKQVCLLVQVACFHWKHKPVTNANTLTQANVSPNKKLYLDACMKSVHTLEHHKVICNLSQNSGVFIVNIIPIIKVPNDNNILKHKLFF